MTMRANYRHSISRLLVTVGIGALLWQPAAAQTAPQAANAATASDGEILVTARRRVETIQSAPISVSAFSSETLKQARIRSFDEIAQRVPGIAINPDNITEPNIFIRGVGTDIESAASSPAVGFFANDVYLARAQGAAMEIFDLERVEVVRGPQGTLYGKNVVGGAINFVTARPTEQFDASGEASYGNYQAYELRAMVNGTLGEGWSGRLAGSTRQRDGFAHNTFTGNDAEALNATGVRVQLRYNPDETLDILLSGDLTRRRDGGQWVDMLEPSEHNLPFKNPKPRSGPNNVDGVAHADIKGTDLHVDWTSDTGTLSSITAYRDAKFYTRNNDAGSYIDFSVFTYDANGRIDLDALSWDQISAINDDYYVNAKTEKVKTFSQELRYTTDLSGPFNLMGGLFYMSEKVRRLEDANYIFILYNNNGGETALTRTTTDTYAAFVEGTFNLTSALSLTAGIRYTHDKKDFTVARGVVHDFLGSSFEDENGNPVTSFTASDGRSFSAWTPSFTAKWQANKDAMIYATVSRGYKSGGWNGENAASAAEARAGYDPEFAWNYEIGAKTDWFDNRLQLNLTAFSTQYSDLQTQQYVIYDLNLPPDNVIANAGKARVRGIEFEAFARPVEGLSLGGNFTYMDGKITGDLISTDLQYDWMCDCSVAVETNLKGNRLRRTPKYAYNLFGRYEAPITDRLQAFVTANYNWSDGYDFENENDPRTYVESRGVLNGSLGIATQDGKWEFSVWGKNITNELYVTGKSDNIGTVLASYAPPQTYGVALRWQY